MPKAPKGWEFIEGRRKRPVRNGRRSTPPGKRLLLINDKTHGAIKDLVEGWPIGEELSWEALMEVINYTYGGNWTRQAVAKHSDLQEAFTKRQKQIQVFRREKGKNAGRRVSRTRDEEVAYLKKQVDLLNQEKADLKQQLEKAAARMNRWRHNAFLHRMTPHQLDAPMQENDRGRSDRR
jgi:hypothetical protein